MGMPSRSLQESMPIVATEEGAGAKALRGAAPSQSRATPRAFMPFRRRPPVGLIRRSSLT